MIGVIVGNIEPRHRLAEAIGKGSDLGAIGREKLPIDHEQLGGQLNDVSGIGEEVRRRDQGMDLQPGPLIDSAYRHGGKRMVGHYVLQFG